MSDSCNVLGCNSRSPATRIYDLAPVVMAGLEVRVRVCEACAARAVYPPPKARAMRRRGFAWTGGLYFRIDQTDGAMSKRLDEEEWAQPWNNIRLQKPQPGGGDVGGA